MNDDLSEIGLRGDRSPPEGDADQLGFGDLAKNLAIALTGPGSKAGIVVGV